MRSQKHTKTKHAALSTLLTTLFVACAAPVPAQAPDSVRAAFSSAEVAAGTPALAWIRNEVLAQRADWPKGRDAARPFSIHGNLASMRVTDALTLPSGCAVVGELEFDGLAVAFECLNDGSESWRIPARELPATLAAWLAPLRIELDGPVRTIDIASLCGHLAGPSVEEDDAARRLHLAALQCGELTIQAVRDRSTIVVRGRSGGGLLGPLFVLANAARRDAFASLSTDLATWRVRAFAGTDGDRIEAARQLQRSGEPGVPALRALLHGDESSRLSAIDGLVRLQAASELPRIVAAAEPDMPLAIAMAGTALDELWPLASEPTRQRVREAIAKNGLFGDSRLQQSVAPSDSMRWRLGALLFVSLCCTTGFWLRERNRLAHA